MESKKLRACFRQSLTRSSFTGSPCCVSKKTLLSEPIFVQSRLKQYFTFGKSSCSSWVGAASVAANLKRVDIVFAEKFCQIVELVIQAGKYYRCALHCAFRDSFSLLSSAF